MSKLLFVKLGSSNLLIFATILKMVVFIKTKITKKLLIQIKSFFYALYIVNIL